MQADIETLVAGIRAMHRQRNFAMESRKRADLSLGSFLRLDLGWRLHGDKAVNAYAKTRAAELAEIGESLAKGKVHPESEAEDFLEHRAIIEASIRARAPFDDIEAEATKQMERLAKQLPVWSSWGEGVRGFSARSLAVIVGEAGDLSNYPEKGHLWKRMGVAVIDGIAQGKLAKTASKSDWIAHGYSKARRSRMFVIGDGLVKQGDEYRAVYLARKEYERQRAEAAGLIVAPSAKIPKARAHEFISDGHIHRMAQRYMEKRLLRDMWKAWRRATVFVPEEATPGFPAAQIREATA